jgi:uncharacterized spore protein YtfJ
VDFTATSQNTSDPSWTTLGFTGGGFTEVDPSDVGAGSSGEGGARIEADVLATIREAHEKGSPLTSARSVTGEVQGRASDVYATVKRLQKEGRLRGGRGRPLTVVENAGGDCGD